MGLKLDQSGLGRFEQGMRVWCGLLSGGWVGKVGFKRFEEIFA